MAVVGSRCCAMQGVVRRGRGGMPLCVVQVSSRGGHTAPVIDLSSSNATGRRESEFERARPFRDIPGPRGWPFIGTLLNYRMGPYSVSQYHKALLANFRKHGPIWKETIGLKTVVHLFEPDYIRIMYQTEGKIPHIPPLLETTQMYRKVKGLSPGLGNTNGEEWYRLRSAVQQMMMRPKAVTMFLPGVNEVITDFLSRLHHIRDAQSGAVPDFLHEILRWQLESSGMTCFETRLGAIESGPDSFAHQMVNSNQALFEDALKLNFSVPLFKIFPTPTWAKLVKDEDFFFGNGQKLVDETVARINELVESGQLKEGQYGFLTYLLAKPELSYKDLSIITLSLFSDGLSTTVPTMIGQLYCIARNPEKQEKLYEEVCLVVPKDGAVTADMINRMPYLKACIKEGFRFFPIGTEVSRTPQKDIVIGGYQIPAGTHVELNNNMLLRLREYFERPDEYIPERWVRGEMEKTMHPYLLIPFGHGPRMCAGRRFAEQEMYVMVARMLRHFRLEWAEEKDMEQTYRVLLRPTDPAGMRFIPR